MLRYGLPILKILSVILGSFLIITRIFIFEKTLGLLQSKIEILWIKIDDYQQYALAKHSAFMQVVSGMMSSALDRVFGPRLISLHSLTVSVCYAFATLFLAVVLLLRYSTHIWNKDYLQFIILYLMVGTAPVFFSYLGRAKKKKYLLIWLTASITFADAMIVLPAFQLWKSIHDSEIAWLASFILILYAGAVVAL